MDLDDEALLQLRPSHRFQPVFPGKVHRNLSRCEKLKEYLSKFPRQKQQLGVSVRQQDR
jgi:hypothetical protein